MLATRQEIVRAVVATGRVDVAEDGRGGRQERTVGDDGDLRVDRRQELVGGGESVENGAGGGSASQRPTAPTGWRELGCSSRSRPRAGPMRLPCGRDCHSRPGSNSGI